jgi:hypothetical protein
MYILVAYPEHPHGMRDANIPLYIPGISLGWRVLVGITKKTSVKETSRKNVYGYDLADYRQIFIQKYNSLPPL